jgi:hypothetical protein
MRFLAFAVAATGHYDTQKRIQLPYMAVICCNMRWSHVQE